MRGPRGEPIPRGQVFDVLGRQQKAAVELPALLAPGAVSRAPRRPFPDSRLAKDDLDRIISGQKPLPEFLDLTERFRRPDGALQLRPIQSEALTRIEVSGGLLGAVPVGRGKTLIALLAPAILKAVRPLLLIPAALRAQCLHDIQFYGQHFNIPQMLVRSYEELSTPDRSGMLSVLVPDLLICDEAHKLRHFSSARVRRVVRYLRDHPDCRFVALSGTITKGSIKDYAHLAAWALDEFSPLPMGEALLDAWRKAIESEEDDDRVANRWALKGISTETEPRAILRDHLTRASGIVLSSGADVTCSLVLYERELEIPKALHKLLSNVMETWQAPNGDELESPLARDRILGQLSCGFYYFWDWSPAPWNGVPDTEWLAARSGWHKAVRLTLQSSFAVEGLDSPMLLARACALEKEVPGRLSKAWDNWFPHRLKMPPPAQAQWVDSYLVDDAVTWAKGQQEPPLLWYTHRAVGAELERRSGFQRYAEGPKASTALIGVTTPHPAVLSIQAHGQGKNLQVWGNQIFVTPMRSATTLEQGLGRTHRQGQARDEVTATLYTHDFFGVALEDAMKSAKMIEETTGQAQRLIYAARA